MSFLGGIHQDLRLIADSDEIAVTASSVDGKQFRLPLTAGIASAE